MSISRSSVPGHASGASLPAGFPARLCSILAALMVLWLTACWFLFFHPAVQDPVKADAIIVLGGASNERLPKGQDLFNAGYAPVLALSHTSSPGNARADNACEGRHSNAVICFVPSELTTRGEARAVARLAADEGWTQLLVVTSTYHSARAELNIEQCSRADVVMAPSVPDLGPVQWLGRFVEESVALTAAYVRPACASPTDPASESSPGESPDAAPASS